MRTLLLYLLILIPLHVTAQMLTTPLDAMKKNYENASKISEIKVSLSDEQIKNIQQSAHAKLELQNIKLFKAEKDGKVIGHGILINKKIRTKNGVVLYIISNESILKGIEVIAFNEPSEYMPSKKYSEQFKNVKTTQPLTLNQNIPTITGATMSAKCFVDGSRVAFALYNEFFKGKN